MREVSFGAAILAACITSTAMGGSGTWQSTNGPAGGWVRDYATVNGVTYAGTNGGLYRSTDHGASWQKVTDVTDRAFTTAIGGVGTTHFAGDSVGGLWRSTDNGLSWSEIINPSFNAFRVFDATDTRVYAIISDFPVTSGAFGGTVWYTEDLGDSWFPIDLGFPVFDLYAEGDLLLVSGSPDTFLPAVVRSEDGGETFITVGETVESTSAPLSFIAIDDFVKVGDVLFCNAQADGVYRSFDNGLNWEACPGIGGLQDQHLASFDGALYVSAFARSGGAFADTGPGVWRSDDNGDFFVRADTNVAELSLNNADELHSTGPALMVGGLWGTWRTTDGMTWESNKTGIAATGIYAMGASANTVFASQGHDGVIHRRANAGGEWQPVQLPDQVYRIWADTDGTLFAGTQVAGIFRSTDGGVNWQAVNTGVPTYNGTAGLQFREIGGFARKDNLIFAVTEVGLQQIPGQQGFWLTGGGVLRSTTDGQSWTTVNSDYPQIGFNNFGEPVYDPAFAVHATDTSVLVSTLRNGFLRSTNNGFTWDPASTGLPEFTTAWEFAELDGAIYAAADFAGVFRSFDDGQTWENTFLPASGRVFDVAAYDGMIYAAVGGDDFNHLASDGVWMFEPESLSWIQAPFPVAGVGARQLAVSGHKLYAGTAGLGVFELAAVAPPPCPNDPDGTLCNSDIAGDDCRVDFADLGALLAAYLATVGDANYNANADLAPVGAPDGIIDSDDLGELLADYLNDCN